MSSFVRINDTFIVIVMSIAVFIAFLLIFYNLNALISRKGHDFIVRILIILLSIAVIAYNVYFLLSTFNSSTHHGYHYWSHDNVHVDWKEWEHIEEEYFQDSEEKDKILTGKTMFK